MQQRLVDWLANLTYGDFLGGLRDVLSLGMAALGAYLAYLAIKLGHEQTRIGKEQTEIAKRQEALDVEQGLIGKRQAEIAEAQHQVLQEQLSRKAELEMELVQDVSTPIETGIKLRVKNKGLKSAPEYYWNFFVPQIEAIRVSMNDGVGSNGAKVLDGRPYAFYTRHQDEPAFPGRSYVLGVIVIPNMLFRLGPITFRWSISAEDGVFPAVGRDGILELSADLPNMGAGTDDPR